MLKENVCLKVQAKDWRDAMRKSGELLVSSGFITEEYIDLTIQCVEELGPYIVIAPGIALSHSRPHSSVLKTGLSLITLKEPVSFHCENDPVDVIITLAAVDDNAHIDKIQIIGEFFSDDDNLERLRNAKSAEDAAAMINSVEV